MASQTLNDRVRDRLKTEKAALGLSEQDLANWMQWGKSKVAQKLGGRTDLTLNELESLCSALSITPTEAVRDRGLEFCAELTPTELRLLEQIRKLDGPTREAILHLANVKRAIGPERFATDPHKPVKARLRSR